MAISNRSISIVAGTGTLFASAVISLTLLFSPVEISFEPQVSSAESTVGRQTEDELPYRIAVPGIAHDVDTVLQLQHGTVVIPPAEGITWGFGDVPCGYGLEVNLPYETRVCFDEGRAAVEIYNEDPRDDGLVHQVLARQTGYQLQP